jgi:methylmalonyl-CoA/ethylmalonyl-CoA epimerase
VSRRVDHTAIVVADLDEALDRYRTLLGAEPGAKHLVPEQRVAVAFLALGDTQLELISPTDPESGVARYLAARGEGLHHVGIHVDDIESELERLRLQGIELIDDQPRQGVHGKIAFVHPRGTGGVLLELVQPAEKR